MFTGIVEDVGEVISCEHDGDIYRLAVRVRQALADLSIGGSVAVNGCCLSATKIEGDLIRFDLARETVARTRFDKRLRPGDLISSGSPAGVGTARGTPIYFKDGDVSTCTIDGIGTLENPVRAEK